MGTGQLACLEVAVRSRHNRAVLLSNGLYVRLFRLIRVRILCSEPAVRDSPLSTALQCLYEATQHAALIWSGRSHACLSQGKQAALYALAAVQQEPFADDVLIPCRWS